MCYTHTLTVSAYTNIHAYRALYRHHTGHSIQGRDLEDKELIEKKFIYNIITKYRM